MKSGDGLLRLIERRPPRRQSHHKILECGIVFPGIAHIGN